MTSRNQPVFSIIIPFHNSGKTDRRPMMQDLLDSIPDRPDVEIIMVDDRSEFPFRPSASPRNAALRILSTPPGERYSGPARNHGVDQTTGRWVLFADSDDIFETDALNSVFDHILRDEECGKVDIYGFMAGTLRESVSSEVRHKYLNEVLERARKSGDGVHLCRYYPPYCKITRRSFVEESGARFGKTRIAQDAYFAVCLAAAKPRVAILDTRAYLIRSGNEAMTTHFSPEKVRDIIEAQRFAIKTLTDAGQEHHAPGMLATFKRLFRHSPRQAIREFLRSMMNGEKVLPSAGHVVRRVRMVVGR